MGTREIVEDLYSAAVNGDMESFFAQLSDDLVLTEPGFLPYGGVYQGKEGMQAMRDGDYRKAKRLFEQEIDRGADYHEFNFWLAIAHLNLGEIHPAQRQLERAIENSTTREQFAIYSTKLRRLKSSITP